MEKLDTEKTVKRLNSILEQELAGVVRYTHYALMVTGPNRLPIVEFMKAQASESLDHAQQVGEILTGLGGHPSLSVAPLEETFQHSLKAILQESVNHEKNAVKLYVDLPRSGRGCEHLPGGVRAHHGWGKKSFTRWSSRKCFATTARRPVPTSNLLISSMSLARSLFYAWEKRLAFKDDPERRVLDFQWGAEFPPPFGSWHPPEITPSESEARALLHDHAERALESSEDYFASCPKIQTNSKTRAPGRRRVHLSSL